MILILDVVVECTDVGLGHVELDLQILNLLFRGVGEVQDELQSGFRDHFGYDAYLHLVLF